MQAELTQSRLQRIAENVNALSKEDMQGNGYDFCYMNLLAVFRQRRPVNDIEELALRCMRHHLCASLQFREFMQAAGEERVLSPEFDAVFRSVHVDPASLETLRRLQETSGVLLAPFHWGAFRYIAMALDRKGFPTTLLMDRATLEPQQPLLAKAKQKTQQYMHYNLGVQYIMAEEPGALVRAHRVLANRGMVMIYPDGNSGWDGPKGNQARSPVRFAGYRLKVKNGVARLAHMTQVPLAIIVAEPAQENKGIVISIRKVLLPPPARGPAAAEQFCKSAMQEIYTEMERCVLQQPEFWESARQLHRWREPVVSEGNGLFSSWQQDLRHTLAQGHTYTLDRSKLTKVGVGDRAVWVDASTMRAYGGDAFTVRAIGLLAEQDGLTLLWHETEGNDAQRTKLLKLFGLLATRGLLEAGQPRSHRACGCAQQRAAYA